MSAKNSTEPGHPKSLPTSKWWRTCGWTLEEVPNVVRATPEFVVFASFTPAGVLYRREARHSQFFDYSPTGREAVEHLRAKAVQRKADLERDLAEVVKILADLTPASGEQTDKQPAQHK